MTVKIANMRKNIIVEREKPVAAPSVASSIEQVKLSREPQRQAKGW